MSGHSKWSTIKHAKAVTDARRGKLFTKLTREIIIAARQGGGDPTMNIRLRMAIQKAKDANMPNDKPADEATDEVCDQCGSPMVIKTGRFGKFMACTGYPKCRNTHPVKTEEDGTENGDGAAAAETTEEVCDKCGSAMVIKTGRFGKFMACTDYPGCKATRPLPTGAACPQCGGDLVEKRGRGRAFYGCARYPECDFTINRRPLPDPCPECNGLMAATRTGAACTNCAWKVAAEPAAA